MNDFSPESFEKKDLPFVVNRLSPSIGGEILGIDLSQQLDKNTKDLISRNYIRRCRVAVSNRANGLPRTTRARGESRSPQRPHCSLVVSQGRCAPSVRVSPVADR